MFLQLLLISSVLMLLRWQLPLFAVLHIHLLGANLVKRSTRRYFLIKCSTALLLATMRSLKFFIWNTFYQLGEGNLNACVMFGTCCCAFEAEAWTDNIRIYVCCFLRDIFRGFVSQVIRSARLLCHETYSRQFILC